ncbi:MAG: 2'-5' RNA ligase family protein [Pseudomonadales bacterium]
MAERKLNGQAPPAVRCFVAATVVAESARRLRAAFLALYPEFAAPRRRSGPVVRAVPLENFHVTLKFLGQVPEDQLPGLVRQVAELPAEAVRAAVVGFAGLPRASRAQAVVADLAPHPQLTAWKQRLELDLGVEDRPFRPHVTLFRCRRPGAFAAAALACPLSLQLRAPRLYRSDQLPGGVRYTPLTCGPEP